MKTRLAILAAVIIVMLVVAAGFPPGSMESDDLHGWLDRVREQGKDISVLLIIVVVIFASIAAVPLGIIIAFNALAFGPWSGSLYTLVGATCGAACSYGIGTYLGYEALCRLAGQRINRVSRQLAKRGILTVFVVRLLPLAPFAVVNMIAGMTHVRLRDFLIGTVFGMLPGIFLIGFSIEQVLRWLEHG